MSCKLHAYADCTVSHGTNPSPQKSTETATYHQFEYLVMEYHLVHVHSIYLEGGGNCDD